MKPLPRVETIAHIGHGANTLSPYIQLAPFVVSKHEAGRSGRFLSKLFRSAMGRQVLARWVGLSKKIVLFIFPWSGLPVLTCSQVT